MKGMQKLAQSKSYVSDADSFTNVGAIVTGIWKATEAQDHFGENLGVAKLPTYTVDGKEYQLGSYSGNKLLGIKPQADSKKALVLSLLAEYLTGVKCQMERFEEFQWGPSSNAAQATDAVKANASLTALVEQNAYAIPQGQIHGSWWDIAKVLGADAKAATSDDDLRAALEAYEGKINALFEMTEEEKQAWSVIGNICGTNWDTDFKMTKISDNVFESDVLALEAGKEYKVRQGASWDVNYGANGFNGSNFVVETTGNYIVRLTITGEKTATVELIAQ
jgi:arabinogalactan oligomer/maltooligosaccharide transport system substrate-binding protein